MGPENYNHTQRRSAPLLNQEVFQDYYERANWHTDAFPDAAEGAPSLKKARARVDVLKKLSDKVYANPREFDEYYKLRKVTVPHPLPADEYQVLAKELWEKYIILSPDHLPFIELIELAQIVANVMGHCMIEKNDKDSNKYENFLNALAVYASYRIALKYPGLTVPQKFRETWALLKSHYTKSVVTVFAANIDLNLTLFSEAVESVGTIAASIRREVPDCERETHALRSCAHDLWKQMAVLQRYTLKQSLFESAFGEDTQWAILDYHQIRCQSSDASPDKLLRGLESCAIFAQKTSRDIPPSLQLEIVESKSEDGYMIQEGLHVPFDYNFMYLLGTDGELYLQSYPVKLPLRPLFKAAHAEGAYEFFCLHAIGRVFDMVVPRVVVDAMPPLNGIRKKIAHANIDGRVARSIIQDIYVPRKIRIKKAEEVQIMIDDEQKELTEKSQTEKQTRSFYGRVGHPRTLPRGYKPHPDAKKWAKEDGCLRELEDNETWCRPVDSPVPVVHRQKGGKN
ncbi:MAG: hypothetical protein AAB400_00745 [Patescibacteria group bacterium]